MNERHLVLHGLAIKKHASPQEVADLVGLDAETVARTLTAAESLGRVTRAGGKWMLTAPAQMALRSEYSREYAQLRANASMAAAYCTFESVNRDLKQLITDWQTIALGGERIRNAHDDADYDQRILDRLEALHERAVPLLMSMSQELPRVESYRRLLTEALERAEDGAIEWVSDARIASYHSVWFELHEDLLRVLGHERDE
jgi:predicted transcriptional regulator